MNARAAHSVRPRLLSRTALAGVLLVVLLAAAPPAGRSQDRSSAADTGATVVAAWTFVHGAARPDPGISVAAAERHAYDLVETYVWKALPPDAKHLVSRLELFVSTDTGDDATDGTATENADGGWTLALDAKEGESALVGGKPADRAVFDEVVAHEVGHVISLNESQRAEDPDVTGYADEDGAFTMSAYLSRFYARFWKDRYPHGSSRDDTDQASARYDEDPDAFVTDYAATDPSEDFAESFAYFVLDPGPSGTADKDRKIQFFYHFPDLVRDRDALRKVLSSAK
jgi:hypothetical protein